MKRGELLDDTEKKYLHEMRVLEKKGMPFTHARMCKAMGWSSVASSWHMQEKLIEAGVLRQGERLARVACPVITSEGLRELRKRAA